MVAEQELEDHRRRELRCAAEAAVLIVELAPQCVEGGVETGGVDGGGGQGGRSGVGEPARDRARGPAYPLAVVAPGRRHRVEEPGEPGGRVVGAAVERLARRGEEARHGPATLARHRLGGRHVDRVDVRPLLAVDLDRHEARVELRGDGGVLERLVRHDVAPVAGRVAHREEHRHVAPGRLLEGGVGPLPPVDGVVGVLEQVGRGRTGKAVGHGAVLTRPGPYHNG